MVIPYLGVQRCVDLHLDTQKGHWEAVRPGIARYRTRGLAADPEPRFSASMVSFMAFVTLTAQPLWYTVSIRVVLATRPPMTASAGYAGIVIGIHSFEAACHRGRGARRRGAKMALWRASHALGPRIPLRVGALSFRVRSPFTQW